MPTETLPVMLSQEERNMKARNVTALLKQCREIEMKAKSAAAAYKEEMKELRTKIDEESEKAHQGYEEREVEVKNVPNADTFTIDIVRLDTEERVRSRPMTEDEMRATCQPSLPLNDRGAAVVNLNDRNKVPTKKGEN